MNNQNPHGRYLRTGRVSRPQQIYLVTMTVKRRAEIFRKHENAICAARCLYDKDIQTCANTLAFVVMPDHLHWLLQLRNASTLSETVRLYKAKVSMIVGQRIWQRGFHDHAFRDEEHVIEAARYIITNPLRAGICEYIGNYPYWNAKWL
jgi:putative transposase